jgi:hypothetical protein
VIFCKSDDDICAGGRRGRPSFERALLPIRVDKPRAGIGLLHLDGHHRIALRCRTPMVPAYGDGRNCAIE